MIAPEPSWYVVLTHTHAENKASAHLERQGFAVYLPRFLKRRRHARRVEIVPAPLFPRYLFVSIDVTTQRWRSVHSTIGVCSLIRNGDMPTAVPNSIVEHLQSRHDERGFIILDTRPRFAPGDKVRVVEGVFTASFGLFEGMTDRHRVSILLDLLGRKVRVVLDAEMVTAA